MTWNNVELSIDWIESEKMMWQVIDDVIFLAHRTHRDKVVFEFKKKITIFSGKRLH